MMHHLNSPEWLCLQHSFFSVLLSNGSGIRGENTCHSNEIQHIFFSLILVLCCCFVFWVRERAYVTISILRSTLLLSNTTHVYAYYTHSIFFTTEWTHSIPHFNVIILFDGVWQPWYGGGYTDCTQWNFDLHTTICNNMALAWAWHFQFQFQNWRWIPHVCVYIEKTHAA